MANIIDFQTLGEAKGVKMVHLNVRSIVKKIDQLRILLNGSKIDILTISESWLKPHIHSDLVSISGFEHLRLDRSTKIKSRKRGGGLLTYVNSKHSSLCEPLVELNKSNEYIEVQWVLIHRPQCKNVVVCNVYRPPSGDLKKAVNYLEECVKTINMSKVDLFILGDLNVNYKNRATPNFKKLHFFAQSNGLTQYIKNTTRNTDKSKTLIDLAMSNSKSVNCSGTLEHFISDHQPIYLVHKKGRDVRHSEIFKGRSYRNYNKDLFTSKLLAIDWDSYYELDSPGQAWDFLLKSLEVILDEMCPVRTFKVKNYRPDWITNELLEQIKDRDYFYKKAKKLDDKDSWNIAKHLRNATNSNIRQAKKEFILNELKENENNCKKFWKTIRKVVPSGSSSSSQDILLKDKGSKIDKSEVAGFINDYFINVGNVPGQGTCSPKPGQSTSFTKPGNVPPCLDLTEEGEPVCLDELEPAILKEIEVHRAVREINISKSSGVDNVSSFAIKEAFLKLIPEVTLMYNLSLQNSEFPAAWKKALVIPIPKAGDSTQVKNYRPISLLPLPGKILERLVHSQLSEHLESLELLAPEQHGFRKKHSTIHSAAQVTNFISSKMDSKLPTLVTYIDFRKAFDCVQHPILLDKLSHLNLSDSFVNWIRSYLAAREQRVLANGIFSASQYRQGVPQGSVLGPLFYIVYANDLIKTVKNCEIALYADDTILFTANNNFQKSLDCMQHDIDAIAGWCNTNGIMANTEKTKVMIFGSTSSLKHIPPFDLTFDNTSLQQVLSYKYLGLTLDNQLNYSLHVSKVIASVSGKLKQFQRMRGFLSAALLVYKCMLLPVLEYGDVFLSAATAVNRKKLQTLQNKGLRCALNKGLETSSESLHTEANILKLKYRREQHLLNLMYDWSLDSAKLKSKSKGGVVTRSSSKRQLRVKKPNTEKFKKALTYRGPKKWNALPTDIHQITDKAALKRSIANWVSRKAIVNS